MVGLRVLKHHVLASSTPPLFLYILGSNMPGRTGRRPIFCGGGVLWICVWDMAQLYIYFFYLYNRKIMGNFEITFFQDFENGGPAGCSCLESLSYFAVARLGVHGRGNASPDTNPAVAGFSKWRTLAGRPGPGTCRQRSVPNREIPNSSRAAEIFHEVGSSKFGGRTFESFFRRTCSSEFVGRA